MTDVRKASVIKLFAKFHVTLKEAWLNDVLGYLQKEKADTVCYLLHLPILFGY